MCPTIMETNLDSGVDELGCCGILIEEDGQKHLTEEMIDGWISATCRGIS